MFNLPEAPRQLRILALVWILLGFISMLGRIRLNLDLGFGPIDIAIMGLVFGPGLMLAWRWVGVTLRWLSWLVIVWCFFVAIGGVIRGGMWGWLSVAGSVGLICILLEQLMILKEPEVLHYHAAIKRAERDAPSTEASPGA